MIKINIYSISKTKEKYLLDGEDEYLTRLRKSAKINLIELGTSKDSSSDGVSAKRQEAERLLARIPDRDFLVVLDQQGKSYSSPEFAEFFSRRMNQGTSLFSFAIGGPFGWDESVLQRADLKLSLSTFTFTSQISRLILIEQLYRAMTILEGSPYHK